MAFVPRSGTDGRVRNGANVIAGISMWAFSQEVTPIPIPHFELTADANGVVYPPKMKGLGNATVRLEGFYNTDTTDNTITGTPDLGNGSDVVLDLYYSKTAATGFQDVTGFISNFEVTNQVENQAVRFTCVVNLTANPPSPGAITP